MIRESQKAFNTIKVIIDSICVFFSVAISYIVSLHIQNFHIFDRINVGLWQQFLIIVAIIAIHLLSYWKFELYKSYRASRFMQEATNILQGNLLSYIFMFVISLVFSILLEVQVFITIFFFINTVVMLGYRYVLKKMLHFIRQKGYNKKYILIIGVNKCTQSFIDKVVSCKDLGFEVLGYIDGDKTNDLSIRYLGDYNKLDKQFKNKVIDEVVIMLKDSNKDDCVKSIDLCEKWGIKFSILPDVFSIFNSNIYIGSFDGFPMLNIRKIPLDNKLYSLLKRAFDIIVGLICLILFSPLMIVIAIIIKITSKGPIIFKQTRVGLNRKEFIMYKFRSMTIDSGSIVKMARADDPRCTKVGRFIRKYSIDELPQLFNVLKGDMSLVGPRPEIPHFVDEFKEHIPSYMLKHYIKPGMTGWAQVNGLRGNTSIPERIKYDMNYIENWSLLFDIKILILTIFKGIFNKNAY